MRRIALALLGCLTFLGCEPALAATYVLDLGWKDLAFTNQMALGEAATVELRGIGESDPTNLTIYLSTKTGDMLAITEGMAETGTYAVADLMLNTTNLLAEFVDTPSTGSRSFDLTVWDSARSVLLASAPVWVKNNPLWESIAFTNLPDIETLGLSEYLARAYTWSNQTSTARYTLDLGWKDLAFENSMALAERAVVEIRGIGTATPAGLMLYLSNAEMEGLALAGYMVAGTNEGVAVGMLNLATTNLLAEFAGLRPSSERTFDLTVWDSERDVMLGSAAVVVRNNPLASQFVSGWTNVPEAVESVLLASVAAANTNAVAALAASAVNAGRMDVVEPVVADLTGRVAQAEADILDLDSGKVGTNEWAVDYATLLNTNLYTFAYLLQVESNLAEHVASTNPHGITAAMIGAVTQEEDTIALAAIAALPSIPTNAATTNDLALYLPLATTDEVVGDGTNILSWTERRIHGWSSVEADELYALTAIWLGGVRYTNLAAIVGGDWATSDELDAAVAGLASTQMLENALLTIPDRFLGDLASTQDVADAVAELATTDYVDEEVGDVQAYAEGVAGVLAGLSNSSLPRAEAETNYVPIVQAPGTGVGWSFTTNAIRVGDSISYKPDAFTNDGPYSSVVMIRSNRLSLSGSFDLWTEYMDTLWFRNKTTNMVLNLYHDLYIHKSGIKPLEPRGTEPAGVVHLDSNGLKIGGAEPLIQSTESIYFSTPFTDWTEQDYSAMSRTGTLVLTNDLAVFHAKFAGEWDGAEIRFSQTGDNLQFWMNEALFTNGISYMGMTGTNTESQASVVSFQREDGTILASTNLGYAQLLETNAVTPVAVYDAGLMPPGATSTPVLCVASMEIRHFNNLQQVGEQFSTRGLDLHVDDPLTEESAANLRTVELNADAALDLALAQVYSRAGNTLLNGFRTYVGPRFYYIEEGENLNFYYGDNLDPVFTIVGGGAVVPKITGLDYDATNDTFTLFANARTSGVYAVDWSTNGLADWTRIDTNDVTQTILTEKTISLMVSNPVPAMTAMVFRVASVEAATTIPKVRSLAAPTSGTNDDLLATQPWVEDYVAVHGGTSAVTWVSFDLNGIETNAWLIGRTNATVRKDGTNLYIDVDAAGGGSTNDSSGESAGITIAATNAAPTWSATNLYWYFAPTVSNTLPTPSKSATNINATAIMHLILGTNTFTTSGWTAPSAVTASSTNVLVFHSPMNSTNWTVKTW